MERFGLAHSSQMIEAAKNSQSGTLTRNLRVLKMGQIQGSKVPPPSILSYDLCMP